MDENIMNGLQNFDRVWNRVTGMPGMQHEAPEGDEATLRRFIADEAKDAAFYTELAHRTKSASRALLGIAGDERGHKRELQVEYFLLTGDTYSVEPSCPVIGNVLDAMRMAYANELKGAKSYMAAAEATRSERLRELYRLNASDEAGHAEKLRNMIAKAIGES